MPCFFLICLGKVCGTNKDFAGPVDPRCSWSYGASNILAVNSVELALS